MKTYPITVQPNPRSPRHFRGRVFFISFQLESNGGATYECKEYGPLTLHRWSWSPRFWWDILCAWIGPKQEIGL